MALCVRYTEIRVFTVYMLSFPPYRPGERAQLVYYEPPGQAVPCVGCGPNHEEMVSVATDEGAQHCAKHGDTCTYQWPKLADTDQLAEWLISYHSNGTIC